MDLEIRRFDAAEHFVDRLPKCRYFSNGGDGDKLAFGDDDSGKDEIFYFTDAESLLIDSVVRDDKAELVAHAKGFVGPAGEDLESSTAVKFLHLCCNFDTALHTAALTHSARCVDVLLKRHARTVLRTRDGLRQLALNLSLSSTRMDVVWNSEDQTVEDLVGILGEKDITKVRLLGEKTKEIGDLAYAHAVEGHIVNLAALLIVAAEKVNESALELLNESGSKEKGKANEWLIREALSLYSGTPPCGAAKRACTAAADDDDSNPEKRKLLLLQLELLQLFGAVAQSGCTDRKVTPPLIRAAQLWMKIFKKWFPCRLEDLLKNPNNGHYALPSLTTDFKAKLGLQLDYKSLGFSKLSEFVKCFSNLFTVKIFSGAKYGPPTHMAIQPNPRPRHQLCHTFRTPWSSPLSASTDNGGNSKCLQEISSDDGSDSKYQDISIDDGSDSGCQDISIDGGSDSECLEDISVDASADSKYLQDISMDVGGGPKCLQDLLIDNGGVNFELKPTNSGEEKPSHGDQLKSAEDISDCVQSSFLQFLKPDPPLNGQKAFDVHDETACCIVLNKGSATPRQDPGRHLVLESLTRKWNKSPGYFLRSFDFYKVEQLVQERDNVQLSFSPSLEKRSKHTLDGYIVAPSLSTSFLEEESFVFPEGNGTVNCAIILGNKILVAVDSRSTHPDNGLIAEESATKTFPVHHRILATMSGVSGLCKEMLESVKSNCGGDIDRASLAAKEFSTDWKLKHPGEYFDAVSIIAGYRSDGKAVLYTVGGKDDEYDCEEEELVIVAVGAGREVASNYCRQSESGDYMEVDSDEGGVDEFENGVLEHLKGAVVSAALDTPSCGGVVRLWEVKPHCHEEIYSRTFFSVLSECYDDFATKLSKTIFSLWYNCYLLYESEQDNWVNDIFVNALGFKSHTIAKQRTCVVRMINFGSEMVANHEYEKWRLEHDSFKDSVDQNRFEHLRLDIPLKIRELPWCQVTHTHSITGKEMSCPVAFLKPTPEIINLLRGV